MVYGDSPDEAKAKVKALALRTLADLIENGETRVDHLSDLFQNA